MNNSFFFISGLIAGYFIAKKMKSCQHTEGVPNVVPGPGVQPLKQSCTNLPLPSDKSAALSGLKIVTVW